MTLQKSWKLKEALIGLILAVFTLAVMTLFSTRQVIELAAILLAGIAAIYIGFALADQREPLQFDLEHLRCSPLHHAHYIA